MTEQRPIPPQTQASGRIEDRWIREPSLDRYLDAHSRYRDNQAITGIGVAIIVPSVVALAAGAVYPLVLWLLTVLGIAIAAPFGFKTWREFERVREAKSRMYENAVTYPFWMEMSYTGGSGGAPQIKIGNPAIPSVAASAPASPQIASQPVSEEEVQVNRVTSVPGSANTEDRDQPLTDHENNT